MEKSRRQARELHWYDSPFLLQRLATPFDPYVHPRRSGRWLPEK